MAKSYSWLGCMFGTVSVGVLINYMQVDVCTDSGCPITRVYGCTKGVESKHYFIKNTPDLLTCWASFNNDFDTSSKTIFIQDEKNNVHRFTMQGDKMGGERHTSSTYTSESGKNGSFIEYDKSSEQHNNEEPFMRYCMHGMLEESPFMLIIREYPSQRYDAQLFPDRVGCPIYLHNAA